MNWNGSNRLAGNYGKSASSKTVSKRGGPLASALPVPLGDLHDGIVQLTVGSDQTGLCHRQLLAAGSRHSTARFFDKQSTGGKIPRRKLIFKKTAEVPGTDLAQIQRCGAEAADSVNVGFKQVGNRRQGASHHRAAVVIDPATDQNL